MHTRTHAVVVVEVVAVGKVVEIDSEKPMKLETSPKFALVSQYQ